MNKDLIDCDKEGGIWIVPSNAPSCPGCQENMELVDTVPQWGDLIYKCTSLSCLQPHQIKVTEEFANEKGWETEL